MRRSNGWPLEKVHYRRSKGEGLLEKVRDKRSIEEGLRKKVRRRRY